MKKIVVIALSIAIVFAGCGKKKEEEAKPVEKVKYVVTEPAEMRKMSQIFDTDAVLVPEAKIDHKTEKGGTVEKLYKKNGETVKKGELVIKLKDVPTEANYSAAKVSYRIAKNNYNKFKTLYDKELISYLEYINYENNYINAKASYDKAKNDYDKLFRKAEIDGVVGNLFAKVGNEVSAKDTLFTVINDKNMESYVGFPGEWLSQLKVGGDVFVKIPDINKTIKGKIIEINPIANEATKKFMVKFGIKNEDRMVKDGMYAYATIPVGEMSVLATKDSGIFIRELLSYVYVVKDGIVTRVEVKPGAVNLPYTAITSDKIKVGDKIVVDGIFGLEEGDKVVEAIK